MKHRNMLFAPAEACESAILSPVPVHAREPDILFPVPAQAREPASLSLAPAQAQELDIFSSVLAHMRESTILPPVSAQAQDFATLSPVSAQARDSTILSPVSAHVHEPTTLSPISAQAWDSTTLSPVSTQAWESVILSTPPKRLELPPTTKEQSSDTLTIPQPNKWEPPAPAMTPSLIQQAQLYPLREAVMPGRQGGIGFVSVPLNSGDVRAFKKEMGSLLDDPIGVSEKFDQFLGPNIYTWDELQAILGILFTVEERGMIRSAGMKNWDQRHQQGPAADVK
ncbi:hypothetical protein BTVI_01176 [Pitangus sulphuratus]|nr:hypothetical protein BTVI_01176 [Pitangus sulphuratus]